MPYRLFEEFDLSSSLSNIGQKLQSEIKHMDLQRILNTKEDILVKELTERHKLEMPSLKEDQIKIIPIEADITLDRDHSSRWMYGHDDGHPLIRRGLRVEVKIPFEGDSDVFKCRASTYTISGTPEGHIQPSDLVLIYETIEKDPQKIKSLWEKDITQIKQNLEWARADIEKHNNSLEQQIKSLIANRRKEAGDNQSLIDTLKR